jgi:hypothetical protein
VIKWFAVFLLVRGKFAGKIGKKLEHGEAVTHLLYGVAVFTELHGEITFYSVAALGLGCCAVLNALLGGGEGE